MAKPLLRGFSILGRNLELVCWGVQVRIRGVGAGTGMVIRVLAVKPQHTNSRVLP